MKLLSPVVYAVASVLAAAACVWTMVFYVSGISWVPQAAFFAVPFLFVGVVLAPCGWGLLRLEESWRPTLLDHARHCAVHYAGLMILGGSWVAFFFGGSIALAPVEFGVFFYTSLAVLVDASVLIYWRRRFDYVSGGNPA
ncbi:MAG: hypothetical protein M3151_14460 [Actinomycetota bacterium]|nr:hypothetical protein [Actinomycetota bacterium]